MVRLPAPRLPLNATAGLAVGVVLRDPVRRVRVGAVAGPARSLPHRPPGPGGRVGGGVQQRRHRAQRQHRLQAHRRRGPRPRRRGHDAERGTPSLWADEGHAGAGLSRRPRAGAEHRLRARGRRGISGTLEPYRDPDCDCEASTTFSGVIHDGMIEGNFVTASRGARGTLGHWKVVRKR